MRFFKKLLPIWTGRTGLLTLQAHGSGLLNKGSEYEATIELREIEQANNLSKISVSKVTGVPKQLRSKVIEILPEWIETDKITWIKETK